MDEKENQFTELAQGIAFISRFLQVGLESNRQGHLAKQPCLDRNRKHPCLK